MAKQHGVNAAPSLFDFPSGIAGTNDPPSSAVIGAGCWSALPSGTACRIVAQDIRPYLQYSITCFFARTRILHRDCRRLYGYGIERVGDLVRLTPEHALAWLNGDVRKFEAMRCALLAVGLDFNSRAPGWSDALGERLNIARGRRLSSLVRTSDACRWRATRPARAGVIVIPLRNRQLSLL